MKEVLADIMKQVAPLFENVIVTGTDDSTTVDAQDKEKMFFLVSTTKHPIPEFKGDFGLGSLSLLNGLLNFASYKTDESKFIIHRQEREGEDQVSEFEFRDRDGAKTKFKTISPRFVGDGKRATIGKIPYDISLPLNKAKATEITQLATMLMAQMTKDTEKMFSLSIEDGKLFLSIGGQSEIKHTSTIFLTDDVKDDLLKSNKHEYSIVNFLAVLKNVGNGVCTANFCSRGVVGVSVETEHAVHNYYLRGNN